MMKQFFSALLICSLLFAACLSSRSLMNKGRYDEAITKSVQKLRKNSNNQKEIAVLEASYRIVMDADSSRIIFLKKEGRPENWEEVYSIYARMKERQDLVKTLPPLKVTGKKNEYIRTVDFHFRNFDEEIIQSKQKAAEFDYTNAVNMLAKGGRQDARNAYASFAKVKKLIPNFRDIDEQMRKAREQGTSYVLLKVRNSTRTVIPKDLEAELLKISPANMDEKWIRYYTENAKGVDYDFFVLLDLRDIEVTPERVKESQFIESREVQDGWQYVKDARGNVMKDSLGNDIKVPRIITISCTVFETRQNKTARIAGNLDMIDAHSNNLMKSFPLIADSKFDNYALIPMGELDALKPETRKRLGGEVRHFPSDENMIWQAGTRLKEMAKDIVRDNDNLLE